MKWIIRLLFIIIILGTSFSHILIPNLSEQTPNKSLDIFTIIYILSFFVIFIFLFYHWAMNSFRSKTEKNIWLAILIIGTSFYGMGLLIYYLFVYEGLLLKKSKSLDNTLNE